MENQSKKCSSKDHKESKAVIYCCNCKVYMCNKCENFHSNLFNNHKVFDIESYLKDAFTGLCNEQNHNNELEYFCKTHNTLCCAACIAKVKNKNNGNHSDCSIYKVEDIFNEKKNKFNENIKLLQQLSDNLKNSINNLKNLFEKMSQNKEELKIKIQSIFTKIRNELNSREDTILLEVDNIYEKTFFNEDMLKEFERLPNKIKASLDKGKLFEKEYDDNKKVYLINEGIKIESNIKDIKAVNENIEKCKKLNKIKIKFSPDENEIYDELEKIKNLGKVKIENLEPSFESSNIIKDDIEKQRLLINWIKEKTKKEEIRFKLLFKMSEHGSEGKDFHKYCDKKGPNLVLIKTKTNRIFGGFTPLNWENKSISRYDESNQTFIFSLNLNKKYDMINIKKKAIQGFSEGYGPNFGDYDFGLHKNMKDGESYANDSCNFLSNNNLDLTGGKGNNESFKTEEFEVFQVLY